MKILIRIVAFLCGCFFIALLGISSNSRWFDACFHFFPNPYRNGDLYLFSNIPGYKLPVSDPKIAGPFKTPCRNISLTLIGDSHMFEFDSTSFCAAQYRFLHWNEIPDTIAPLDHSKRNILIVETAERYCKWVHTDLFVLGSKSVKDESAEIKLGAENNLQFILTNLDWELPLKELKAFIRLHYFDKIDNRVAKPSGDGRLYLASTINPGDDGSGTQVVQDGELNYIVSNVNQMYKNARALGFDEVYLAIIPNSASLYRSADLPYNHIIERIQQHPDLKAPVIDAYHLLKQQSASVFYVNDSHWNDFGKKLWLAKVDSILKGENH